MRTYKLTLERALECFDYNPDTGSMKWKVQNTLFANIGDEVGTPQLPRKRYRIVCVDAEKHRVHRIAWLLMMGNWPRHNIDHVDGDGMNNRWDNLREATGSENLYNRSKTIRNTSGFKGVHLQKNKWAARIQADGVNHWLGVYNTPEEASKAYDRASLKFHGKYAYINRIHKSNKEGV